MSKVYNKTPAELLYVDEQYAAYCLNEACAYIRQKMDAGEDPLFKSKAKKKKYSSFTEMYDGILKGGEVNVR